MSLEHKVQGGNGSSGEVSGDSGSRSGMPVPIVAVMMKSMQAAGKMAAPVDLRRPAMLQEVCHEWIAHRETLRAVVDGVLGAGLPTEAEVRLRGLLLGTAV